MVDLPKTSLWMHTTQLKLFVWNMYSIFPIMGVTYSKSSKPQITSIRYQFILARQWILGLCCFMTCAISCIPRELVQVIVLHLHHHNCHDLILSLIVTQTFPWLWIRSAPVARINILRQLAVIIASLFISWKNIIIDGYAAVQLDMQTSYTSCFLFEFGMWNIRAIGYYNMVR